MANVSVSVMRYFPETNMVAKNGKLKRCVVDVRKMEIRGEFIVTNLYQATLVKRHGDRHISVKQRQAIPRPWWDKGPPEYKWVKEGNYALDKFPAWLAIRLRTDQDKAAALRLAEAFLSEMLTAPPENMAA